MKKYYLLIALFLFSLLGFSQKKEKVKGSQIVTIEQKKIESFDTLEVEDNLTISIVKGEKCGLEIEADDNLHEVIGIELNGSTLRLTSRKNVSSSKKFLIRVTYTDNFKMAITRNEAVINALADIELNDITFKCYDYSKLFLNAKTKNFTLMANDKTKTELNLKSENTTIELSKNSYLKSLVTAAKLKLDMYQKSEAILEGDVTDMKIRLDNNSDFTGKKLVAKNVEIITEGSANCSLNVTKTLSIEASGTSEIELYGDQKIEMKKFADQAILTKKIIK